MFYFTCQSIEGPYYEEFIEFACEYSQIFSLIIRDQSNPSKSYLTDLAEIEAHCISATLTNSWPGTTTVKPILYKKYLVNEQTKAFLLSKTDSLFKWLECDLPEDLTFYIDDQYWIVATSHENQCDVYAYEPAIVDILEKNKIWGLRSIGENPNKTPFDYLWIKLHNTLITS